LICDSSVGFTGGVGIAEEWEGDARNPSEWRDTHIELRGPAVESLRAAFLDSWNGSGRWSFQAPSTQPASLTGGCPVQVVRSSATVGWTDSATMVRTLIAIAEHTLDIVTAYFHPDERLQELLVEARQRGVRVRVLVPGKYTDSRACQIAGFQAVERLVSAGIDIFFYHRTMLHAKWAAADGRIACIGSANFNYRSMYKDEECCVVAVSNDVVAALESGLENDLRHSERVELTRWRKRARYKKGLEHIVRIVREQL
jgi:cardiolipin synthase